MTPTPLSSASIALAALLAATPINHAQTSAPHALMLLPGELCPSSALPCDTHGLILAGVNHPSVSQGLGGIWWGKPGIYGRAFGYKGYLCEIHIDVTWFPWDPISQNERTRQLVRQNTPWRAEFESAAWQVAQAQNPTPERFDKWAACVPPRLQIDNYMYDLGAAVYIMFNTPPPALYAPQPSIGIWSFIVQTCVHETTGLPVQDNPNAPWRLNLAGKSLPAAHWQLAGNPNDPLDDHNYLFVRTPHGDAVCSGGHAESRRPGVKDLNKIFADGFEATSVFTDGFDGLR